MRFLVHGSFYVTLGESSQFVEFSTDYVSPLLNNFEISKQESKTDLNFWFGLKFTGQIPPNFPVDSPRERRAAIIKIETSEGKLER